ncbi:MAG: hypothetical protein ACREVR_17225, partial [Burkholderiales bacterium]
MAVWGRSLDATDAEIHGAEQGAPQTVPMPEHPSSAVANGAATSVNSTMTTMTLYRIPGRVSHSRTGDASRPAAWLTCALLLLAAAITL